MYALLREGITIVHEQFRHKLSYFLFCQIFEILFITSAEILIIIIKLNSEIFDCQV